MNALVYVDIDRGIHKVKLKVARNEKRKKTTLVFFLHEHSKFWCIFLGEKVERTPLIFDECTYRECGDQYSIFISLKFICATDLILRIRSRCCMLSSGTQCYCCPVNMRLKLMFCIKKTPSSRVADIFQGQEVSPFGYISTQKPRCQLNTYG